MILQHFDLSLLALQGGIEPERKRGNDAERQKGKEAERQGEDSAKPCVGSRGVNVLVWHWTVAADVMGQQSTTVHTQSTSQSTPQPPIHFFGKTQS